MTTNTHSSDNPIDKELKKRPPKEPFFDSTDNPEKLKAYILAVSVRRKSYIETITGSLPAVALTTLGELRSLDLPDDTNVDIVNLNDFKLIHKNLRIGVVDHDE